MIRVVEQEIRMVRQVIRVAQQEIGVVQQVVRVVQQVIVDGAAGDQDGAASDRSSAAGDQGGGATHTRSYSHTCPHTQSHLHLLHPPLDNGIRRPQLVLSLSLALRACCSCPHLAYLRICGVQEAGRSVSQKLWRNCCNPFLNTYSRESFCLNKAAFMNPWIAPTWEGNLLTSNLDFVCFSRTRMFCKDKEGIMRSTRRKRSRASNKQALMTKGSAAIWLARGRVAGGSH